MMRLAKSARPSQNPTRPMRDSPRSSPPLVCCEWAIVPSYENLRESGTGLLSRRIAMDLFTRGSIAGQFVAIQSTVPRCIT